MMLSQLQTLHQNPAEVVPGSLPAELDKPTRWKDSVRESLKHNLIQISLYQIHQSPFETVPTQQHTMYSGI